MDTVPGRSHAHLTHGSIHGHLSWKVTDPTDTGQPAWTLVLKVTDPMDTGQYT